MRATERQMGSPEAAAGKIHLEMREAYDLFDLASGHRYFIASHSW